MYVWLHRVSAKTDIGVGAVGRFVVNLMLGGAGLLCTNGISL